MEPESGGKQTSTNWVLIIGLKVIIFLAVGIVAYFGGALSNMVSGTVDGRNAAVRFAAEYAHDTAVQTCTEITRIISLGIILATGAEFSPQLKVAGVLGSSELRDRMDFVRIFYDRLRHARFNEPVVETTMLFQSFTFNNIETGERWELVFMGPRFCLFDTSL
jgi:hypothetical protein